MTCSCASGNLSCSRLPPAPPAASGSCSPCSNRAGRATVAVSPRRSTLRSQSRPVIPGVAVSGRWVAIHRAGGQRASEQTPARRLDCDGTISVAACRPVLATATAVEPGFWLACGQSSRAAQSWVCRRSGRVLKCCGNKLAARRASMLPSDQPQTIQPSGKISIEIGRFIEGRFAGRRMDWRSTECMPEIACLSAFWRSPSKMTYPCGLPRRACASSLYARS